MCGIVPGRGWQIITVALEPKMLADYIENWDIIINKEHKVSLQSDPHITYSCKICKMKINEKQPQLPTGNI